MRSDNEHYADYIGITISFVGGIILLYFGFGYYNLIMIIGGVVLVFIALLIEIESIGQRIRDDILNKIT